MADCGAGGFRTDVRNDFLELLAVFTTLNRIDVRTDEFDVVLVEHTVLVQRHRSVERGLSAEGRKQRIRAFFRDDPFNDIRGDRFDVGGVGEFGVGHDRCGVRIHEDHAESLCAQNATGLSAGVIEFARLSDHDRT